ncbi:hypothetical protein LCGC14_0327840 [marine sediment metagenome]|uniref:Uncharacterized protein n=1 Tax=marine sediment metagenome TaxID=412755 RepID=A0A0F9U075_9ZZZZ
MTVRVFIERCLAPLAAAVVILLAANAFVSWRTLAVVENDVAHLTASIERIEAKVDRLLWQGGPKQ